MPYLFLDKFKIQSKRESVSEFFGVGSGQCKIANLKQFTGSLWILQGTYWHFFHSNRRNGYAYRPHATHGNYSSAMSEIYICEPRGIVKMSGGSRNMSYSCRIPVQRCYIIGYSSERSTHR